MGVAATEAFQGLAPGWYRDQSDPNHARYWDGAVLGEERRPITQPVTSPSRRFATPVLGAAIPALLYLLFIFHYSLNVPIGDDWSVVPLADATLHGHLSLGDLWAQYGTRRIFLARAVFAVFTVIGHLNEKSIIMFSGVVFVASFVLLLGLVRTYLGELTFLSTLVLGAIWFSLVDLENALWSFQVAWYLALFFFVAMAYLLLVPQGHRNRFFALAVVAAVAGSFCDVWGFVLWPVGFICLMWDQSTDEYTYYEAGSPLWMRRMYYEPGIWIGAFVITAAFYAQGYQFGNPGCAPAGPQCSLSYGFDHPIASLRFLLLQVGNEFPSFGLAFHYLLGVAICAAAVYVCVRTVREREHANPLPLAMIVFGVLFDFAIDTGRIGNPALALYARYSMPNLVLIAGIVVFAMAHIPDRQPVHWEDWLRVGGSVAVVVFVLAQCVSATSFGISEGRFWHSWQEADARVLVNLGQIPVSQVGCDIYADVWPPTSPFEALAVLKTPLALAEQDHLSLFHASVVAYKDEGPPIARC